MRKLREITRLNNEKNEILGIFTKIIMKNTRFLRNVCDSQLWVLNKLEFWKRNNVISSVS